MDMTSLLYERLTVISIGRYFTHPATVAQSLETVVMEGEMVSHLVPS